MNTNNINMLIKDNAWGLWVKVFLTPLSTIFQLYRFIGVTNGQKDSLTDWCLMPTLAVFQIYHG